MKKRSAALVALVVLAAPACRRQAQGAGGMPPMPVEVVTLAERAVEQTTEYIGTVKSRRSTTIQPQVEGFLTRIAVRSGDRVRARRRADGDRRRPQEAAVASLEAQRAAREADLRTRGSRPRALKTLLEAGAVEPAGVRAGA